ncbi:GNAT family N-acetyltransferase [Streptomyces sp. NPDC093085]|uniref:GNAT family N-acetyltransferase n=1 Tax=Streptomyces sp. NPDC093085 TaxID=3155068 RepID=UPI00343241B0
MSLEVRTVAEAEFPEWVRALNVGFLRPPTDSDEAVEWRRGGGDPARTRGAFENGRCVATFRSFEQELTVPGGAAVRADAVSNVSVSPTHRRRGLLGRMMAEDLARAKERGDVLATLISAEYPIYGRYGFGPATSFVEWAVDVPRTGLDPRRHALDGEIEGRIDLADGAEVRKLGPALHGRFRARQPGAVTRDERWWEVSTGSSPRGWISGEPYFAVYRSGAGEVEGLAVYAADDRWDDAKQPTNTATVRDLIAVTPAAERALWRFVCSVDWVTTVRTGLRAPDDLLPDFLPDPRAARTVTEADFLWVRVLDTVRALEARTYEVPGTLVLEVHDAAGLAGGRFRLTASPEGGASCVPTTDGADLALDVRELGALCLGGTSAVRLAALGAVTEERPGAVAVAETLFRTARQPWCPDIF